MNMSSFILSHKLEEMADQFPDRVALQIKTRKYTYQDCFKASQSIAQSLIALGIKAADRIAIVLENRPEWVFAYFGIVAAGATAVPIDFQSTKEDLEYILADCGAKMAFIDNRSLLLFKGLNDKLKLVVVDQEKASKNTISFSELSSKPLDSKVSGLRSSPESIASILYTSGTTGKPKGVMLTHSNLCSNFQSLSQFGLVSAKDNILSILPLHHSYPFMVTLIVPLFSGAKITYASSLKKDELLVAMQESAVTILVGVPQLFHRFYEQILGQIKKIPFLPRGILLAIIELFWLLSKVFKVNLNSLLMKKVHRAFGRKLRFFACGGARLNKPAALFLGKIGFRILEGYGLSETSPAATFNSLKKQRFGSVGKPIPGVQVRILNPNSQGVGEVAIKGANVMKGYYHNDQATREAIKDGWFYSGDLGYLDKAGYLYLSGRKKELIVLSSGKNISPEEVEAHYARSPFVKEICVLETNAENEQLKAVIVPAMEHYRRVGEVNIQERLNWDLEGLSRQLPAYKRIMGFIVSREDLPRTRLGKIKRHEVKSKYSKALDGQLSEYRAKPSDSSQDLELLSSRVGKGVIEVLARELKIEREVNLDDHLELDLGIDSLGRAELVVALEKNLKVNIPDYLISEVFTVREIVSEIEKLARSAEAEPETSEVISWSQLLKQDPPQAVIKRIDLRPNWLTNLFNSVGCGMLRGIFKLFWRLKVSGADNLPKSGAFIVCSNHNSFLDGFLIVAALPRSLRKNFYTLGLRGYFQLPLIKNIVKVIKAIPIDPAMGLVDTMQACSYLLRNNKTICIFPEGGRSIDGEVKQFKKGVAILTKELKVPIVPAYIKGSYQSWSRLRRFPRPWPIEVIFGQAFDYQDVVAKGAKADYQALAGGIRREVVNLRN